MIEITGGATRLRQAHLQEYSTRSVGILKERDVLKSGRLDEPSYVHPLATSRHQSIINYAPIWLRDIPFRTFATAGFSLQMVAAPVADPPRRTRPCRTNSVRSKQAQTA